MELELKFEVCSDKGNLLSELAFGLKRENLKLNVIFSQNRSRSHHVFVEQSADSMNNGDDSDTISSAFQQQMALVVWLF